MSFVRTVRLLCVAVFAALLLPGTARGLCVGSCDGDDIVTVDEITMVVRIALGESPLAMCPTADADDSKAIDVSEIVEGVHNALHGCDGSGSDSPLIAVSVQTITGEPVNDFQAHVEERRRRDEVTMDEQVAGDQFLYALRDPAAAAVISVSKPGYQRGLALLLPDTEEPPAPVRAVTISLIPETQCLDVPGGEPRQRSNLPFVPGDVIVGFSDWFLPEEKRAILDTYCLNDYGLEGVCNGVAIWLDVVDGDPEAVVAELMSDDRVAFARIRGWSGGAHRGVSVVARFNCSISGVNEADDVVSAIEGVEWLQTIRDLNFALAKVDPGEENAWIHLLLADPNVKSASLNLIASIH